MIVIIDFSSDLSAVCHIHVLFNCQRSIFLTASIIIFLTSHPIFFYMPPSKFNTHTLHSVIYFPFHFFQSTQMSKARSAIETIVGSIIISWHSHHLFSKWMANEKILITNNIVIKKETSKRVGKFISLEGDGGG